MFSRLSWLAALFLVGLASTVLAGDEPLARIAEDFRPLTGYVVMPLGDDYLIDLDAADGVQEGDLFALVASGEKIIHPVTKEVIGTLDAVSGYLRVTRIKSGYSYARPLAEGTGAEPGAAIRRYEGLPALFWDYTGEGEGLYAELRAALPHLDWQGYRQAQADRPETPGSAPAGPPARLLFVFNDRGLGVKDGALRPLHFYAVASARTAAGKAVSPPEPAAALPAPGESTPPPAPAAVIPAPQQEGIDPGREATAGGGGNVRRGPDLRGEPAGLAVGDFDGDGRYETAVAFPDRVELLRVVDDDFQILGSVALGPRVKAVALAAADLFADGRPELYVTAADGTSLASAVIGCEDGVYRVIREDLPWYFRSVDLPGEGPTLVGQGAGRGEDDFSGRVFRVAVRDGELTRGEPLELPRFVEIYGFTPFRPEPQQLLFANLSVNDNIQILTPEGERLWQSDEVYGGREAFVERPDPNAMRDVEKRHVFLKAPLVATPQGLVLVPFNKGSRVLTRMREFKSSHLRAMEWDGFALREAWRTTSQGGYLADFAQADADNDGQTEIVMAVLFSHAGFLSKPRAAVVIYELP